MKPGAYLRTPEIRAKQRAAALGRSLSADTKQKISAVFKGRRQSPEHIAARRVALKGRRAWNKGKPLPGVGHPTADATRQKLSESMRADKNPRYQPDRALVAARLASARFMRECLRRLRVNKTSTSATILGYDKNSLLRHIEAQFLDGMRREGYGRVWEIDHVEPVAAFVARGETDPRIINALSNLQPLWVSDNRRKRDTVLAGRSISV